VKEDQTTTSGSNHQNMQMELDRTYTKEGKHKHHKASLRMESTGTTEARKATKHMTKKVNIWIETKMIKHGEFQRP
jgi:hypothetical protein